MIRIMLLFFFLVAPVVASAKNLGIVGKTYPFAEKDALSEIEERAKQVDWNKHLANLKKGVASFRPELPEFPRVVADRVRLVEPTYTLDMDVSDSRDLSKVLYPKGFTFNPFQYMSLPGCVLFIDASDRKQLAWLKKSRFVAESTARILLTGGDIVRMEETFSRPFFYADSTLAERFDIMAVPSAACQKGVSIEIHEFLP